MNKHNLSMLVDFYELTMANGYLLHEYSDKTVYFDMFFRKKGNFNRPFEYIVFQMGQINVCRADISEASER